MFRRFSIRTKARVDFVEITHKISDYVRESGVKDGICVIYVPHTTAGVFINENADPDVVSDIESFLSKLVPWVGDYRHIEGNAAAHIKSILTGNSISIPVVEGKLSLGRWQGIFFAEFDGPRERNLYVKITQG